jgi:putative colanic acid biosynthesis UDP-glucose lipid carrier transferase
MLLHRIRGLWNTYHGILAVILTVVFWTYLMIAGVVYKEITGGYQRFILYNAAGVLGLGIAAIRGRSAAATLLAAGFLESHTLALKQTVFAGAAMLIVLLADMDATMPRQLSISLLFGFLLVLYIVFLNCHLLVPKQLAQKCFSTEEYEQRTLLIGPIDKARNIAKWIEETAAFGFGMTGTVRSEDEDEEPRILHLTHVSDGAMLERIIMNEGINQVLLLAIPPDREELRVVLDVTDKTGVRALVLNNLSEIFNHDIGLFKLQNQAFISLRDEPLQDLVSRILKRTMDLIVSLWVLIFVLPFACLVVKMFQAIQSPGPLFHQETRSGLAKRPFRIFKFRTMHINKADTSPEKAMASDARTYPIGRILRKRGLDKIPLFLNVFFGDMSVVGPAPRSIIKNRRFSEIINQYHIRAWAKPGVTGLAQSSGFCGDPKDDDEVVESAKLDIKYIENWSLPFDLWIMWSALFQVVKPPLR